MEIEENFRGNTSKLEEILFRDFILNKIYKKYNNNCENDEKKFFYYLYR